MRKFFRTLAFLFCLCAATALATVKPPRASLFPNLQPAQTLTYLIRYQSDKNVKTEGSVAAPMAPTSGQTDAHGLLQIEILEVQPVQSATGRSAVHARAKFLNLDSGLSENGLSAGKSGVGSQRSDSRDKIIEFTISTDGSVVKMQGLDDFAPDQQQAWQEWIARFALAWTFPSGGVRLGEKWKSEHAEPSPAPIAGLIWARESTYVRNEPCRVTQLLSVGEAPSALAPAETCAVVLTKAKLKQKSSPDDSTPEAFRLHNLRTAGTAEGLNEIITYIALRTGLLMRATESASQSMDVLIALADNSNAVHYNVMATSQSEVLLVTNPPPAHR